MVRDAIGELELQTGGGDTSWALLDRLASTVAQTDSAGAIQQLSDYSDFGIQALESVGWNAALDYTGEPGDLARNQNLFYARTYDPVTGAWASQDSWRGLLTAPQTLNRYAYGTSNPATLIDVLGNRPWDPAVSVQGKNKDGWVYGPPAPTNTGTIVSTQGGGDRGYCRTQDPCAKTIKYVPPVHKDSPIFGKNGPSAPFIGGRGMSVRGSSCTTLARDLPCQTLAPDASTTPRPIGSWAFEYNMFVATFLIGGLGIEGLLAKILSAGQGAKPVFVTGALTAQEVRSLASLQRNVAEHQAKLAAYGADPYAFDNLGILAKAPNEAARQSIINGRINHLETEISTFQRQVDDLMSRR